ncbi:MAG: hypothetical protein NTX76_03605 [Alphaproteobacteria bacterium]|nr:hypothetical protein [Alphaproteobacteria bacterium]
MRQKWNYNVSIICAVSFLLAIEDGWAAQEVEDVVDDRGYMFACVLAKVQENGKKQNARAVELALESIYSCQCSLDKKKSDEKQEKCGYMPESFLLGRINDNGAVDKKPDERPDESVILLNVSFFGSLYTKLMKFIPSNMASGDND